jgi:hypothetical protein
MNQRVQGQPLAFPPRQRLVDERRHHGQRRARHVARGLRRKGSVKHRQPRKHLALDVGEKAP